MKYIAIIDSDNELSADAIKELKETVFVGDEKAPYCFDITSIKKAPKMASIKALEQEPSSSGKPNEWIPVSERLPELEESVLIFTTDKEYHVAYRRYKAWQNIEYEWFIFGMLGASLAYDEEEVIAWMPLPEPYRAESEE